MAATKRERLEEFIRRLANAGPFDSGDDARAELAAILTQVEDELSGILENPNAAFSEPDGRMYPPHDKYEKASGCSRVRTFRQNRHRTEFGDNGAIRICTADGAVEFDLPGRDGKAVTDLIQESENESPQTALRKS